MLCPDEIDYTRLDVSALSGAASRPSMSFGRNLVNVGSLNTAMRSCS